MNHDQAMRTLMAPTPVCSYRTPFFRETFVLQAMSLLISMVEELCLGAAYAGDVVPDLLANAFDAFKDTASTPSAPTAAAQPVLRELSQPPLASLAGLQAAFGGEDALARFMLPLSLSPSPPAGR